MVNVFGGSTFFGVQHFWGVKTFGGLNFGNKFFGGCQNYFWFNIFWVKNVVVHDGSCGFLEVSGGPWWFLTVLGDYW